MSFQYSFDQLACIVVLPHICNMGDLPTYRRHENVFYQKAHELRCFVDNQFIKGRRELSSQSCNCLRKFVLFILFSVIYLIRENGIQISTEFKRFISS